jgi:hypothetical protein
MQNADNTKSEARQQLKAISQQLKPLVKAGEFNNLNEAIVQLYKDATHQEFKTFNQWKREGYIILKGSKAFPVWAQPVKGSRPKEGASPEDYEYFPVCYLFSNAQVRRTENV